MRMRRRRTSRCVPACCKPYHMCAYIHVHVTHTHTHMHTHTQDSNSEESRAADPDSHHLDSTKSSFLPDASMGAPALTAEKLGGGGLGREGGEKGGGGGRTARVMHIQKGRCLGKCVCGGWVCGCWCKVGVSVYMCVCVCG